MTKENESSANNVAAAITEAVASVADTKPDAKPKDEEKLDAQAELFVRKISDSVTKAIAELLYPSPSDDDDDDDDDDDEDDTPRRPRKKKSTPAPAPKKRSFLTFLG
jgi:hypothetical protein